MDTDGLNGATGINKSQYGRIFMSVRKNLHPRSIVALTAVIISLLIITFVAHVVISQPKEPPPTSKSSVPANGTTNESFSESSVPGTITPLNGGQAQQGNCAVITQHNDNNRSGAYLNEAILNTSNVNPKQFGKLFARQVDGQIYAQPLYLCNVNIPNHGIHNVIYVATMHNTVYAFDADDPNATEPLWDASLGPSIPLPDPNIGDEGYGDITVEVGIVSTPYISTENNNIYVVSTNKDPNRSDAGAYSHWLHALDIGTGAEKLGGPVKISASYPGDGNGSVNGIINFTSNKHLQRSALLLSSGMIYIAFASYGDAIPAHGWVMAYDANTMNQTAVYVTTPDDVPGIRQMPGLGAIWQGGQGPAADSSGNIYFITGNGDFNGFSNPMPRDLGDSFVKLTSDLKLADWFSPFNNDNLSANDMDLGSGGALLIPDTNLLVGGGKEGKLYLINRTNMGHFNPYNDDQTVQPPLPVGGGSDYQGYQGYHELFGGTVYWNSTNGSMIYESPIMATVKAYRLVAGVLQPEPISESKVALDGSGGFMSISANGSLSGTGILWVSEPNELHAFDASNLQNELWNSEMNPERDNLGMMAKFCPPTIANGKVYMATFSGYLAVYGSLS